MKTFTVFRQTYIDQSTAITLKDIADARKFKMSYSKIQWYKTNLSLLNVKEAFFTMIDAVDSGLIHPAIKVRTDTLESVFELTNIFVTQNNNNVDYDWRCNEQVETIPTIQDSNNETLELAISSVSVGDLIHDGERYYIVTPHRFLTF